jgi:hypothetical protein
MGNENDMVTSINYTGLETFLNPVIGRKLKISERGKISSAADCDAAFIREASMLVDKSIVHTVAYLRYALSPKLAGSAGLFVEDVLICGMSVDEWFGKYAD